MPNSPKCIRLDSVMSPGADGVLRAGSGGSTVSCRSDLHASGCQRSHRVRRVHLCRGVHGGGVNPSGRAACEPSWKDGRPVRVCRRRSGAPVSRDVDIFTARNKSSLGFAACIETLRKVWQDHPVIDREIQRAVELFETQFIDGKT
jgi:hypothetical protein